MDKFGQFNRDIFLDDIERSTDMIHYVKLTRYMSGPKLAEQLDEIVEASLFDEDLRVFFSNSNNLTMADVAYMMRYFEPMTCEEFKDNVIFKPTKYGLSRAGSPHKFVDRW